MSKSSIVFFLQINFGEQNIKQSKLQKMEEMKAHILGKEGDQKFHT